MRHRLLVLVPTLLLASACSRGDDRTVSSSPLDRDLTLSAQLQRSEPSGLPELASGGACQREATPKAPTAAQRTQAAALEQRAAEAEFVGNIRVARDLHRQAARLDGTSEEIAYRLARAEEASGEKAAAVKGYCRYLSLAPSAANAKDVRARLSTLLPNAPVQVASKSAPQVAPQIQPQRAPRAVARTVRTPARESQTTYATAPVEAAQPETTAAPAGSSEPTQSEPAQSFPAETDGSVYASSNGDVVTQRSEPVSVPRDEPSARRTPDHTVRNAAIGAAAGAAVGAAVSRSVKGAVIGGVAGGFLGAVVGRSAAGKSGFRTPGWAH